MEDRAWVWPHHPLALKHRMADREVGWREGGGLEHVGWREGGGLEHVGCSPLGKLLKLAPVVSRPGQSQGLLYKHLRLSVNN